MDARVHSFPWPIGPWPDDGHLRKLGFRYRQLFSDGLQAISLTPLPRLGMPRLNVEDMLRNVKEEIWNGDLRAETKMYVMNSTELNSH